MHLLFKNRVQQRIPALIAGEIEVLLRKYEKIGITDQARFDVLEAMDDEERDQDLDVQPNCILSFSLLHDDGQNSYLDCTGTDVLRGKLYENPMLGMAFVYEHDTTGVKRLQCNKNTLMTFCKDVALSVVMELLENEPSLLIARKS